MATSTITYIKRNILPETIVVMSTTADLATITTTGYWLNEVANVAAQNNGHWEWLPGDAIKILYATNLVGWFTFNSSTNSFVAFPSGSLPNALPSADIFVGNASNIATARAMSGDATMNNTGGLTIAPIGFSKLMPEVSAQISVILEPADIIGMYATPRLLVAAPGDAKIILIDDLTWSVFATTTAFTAGGAIAAQYGNAAHGAGPAASGSLPAASLNGVTTGVKYLANAGYDNVLNANDSSVLNAAVYLSNQTAAFATGDASVILYVRYRILDIS